MALQEPKRDDLRTMCAEMCKLRQKASDAKYHLVRSDVDIRCGDAYGFVGTLGVISGSGMVWTVVVGCSCHITFGEYLRFNNILIADC